jgi:hypothetical protein
MTYTLGGENWHAVKKIPSENVSSQSTQSNFHLKNWDNCNLSTESVWWNGPREELSLCWVAALHDLLFETSSWLTLQLSRPLEKFRERQNLAGGKKRAPTLLCWPEPRFYGSFSEISLCTHPFLGSLRIVRSRRESPTIPESPAIPE